MSVLNRCLSALLCVLMAPSAWAQLSGFYDIAGGVTQEYATISAAVADLNSQGISGPVTFRLWAVSFDEQVTIEDFARTGRPDDLVTFRSNVLGGSTEWTYSAARSRANWVVRVDGGAHLRFENIEFKATAPSPYGRLVLLDDSDAWEDVTFDGCVFRGLLSFQDSSELILLRADGIFGGAQERLTVENSSFIYGQAGVFATDCTLCTVRNSTFEDQNFYGIYMDGGAAGGVFSSVEDNTISDWGNSFDSYTALVALRATDVMRNEVSVIKGANGIRHDANAEVVNNLVYANSPNVDLGIWVGQSGTRVYHNTVYAAGNSDADALGFYRLLTIDPQIENVDLQNNILISASGGLPLSNTAGSPYRPLASTSDYNLLYTTGPALARLTGSTYTDIRLLADDQQAGNANSVSAPVTFVSVSVSSPDLRLAGTSIHHAALAGARVPAVSQDLFGNGRGTAWAYMGGHEPAQSFGPLSGTYALGPSSASQPRFLTFTDAVRGLELFGVSGTTTFEAQAGTYDEQLRFSTRYTQTVPQVTFKPATGAAVTLQYTGVSLPFWPALITYDAILRNVRYENLTLRAPSPAAPNVSTRYQVFNFEESSSVEIIDCTLSGRTSAASDEGSLIIAAKGLSDSVIQGNSFTWGWRGLDLNNSLTAAGADDNTIEDNIFFGQVDRAIHVDNFEDTDLIDNAVSTSQSQASDAFIGIYAGVGERLQIERNIITLLGGSIGITVNATTASVPYGVYNNMIAISASAVKAKAGLHFENGPVRAIHNTVLTNAVETSYAALQTNGLIVEFLNNVLYATDKALPLRWDNRNRIFGSVDYNLLYGTVELADVEGTLYPSLPDYQAGTGLDLNSVSKPVTFAGAASPFDLHLAGSSLGDTDLRGIPVFFVPEDIDGDARSMAAPYVGADEGAVSLAGVELDIDMWLGGAYDASLGFMPAWLNVAGILNEEALTSPYSACGPPASVNPFFFSSNSGLVDWICVELRTGTDASTVVARQSVFVNEQGNLVALNGVSQPTMDAVPGSYYVVLSHRNHHAAMTSRSISGSSGTLTIDFRASLGFGANAQQRLSNGQYALWGGNADVLNNTTNGDAVAWVSENGTEGEYVLEDFD
ncbi:MAG: right-handed parallel beta-helix repeat-containing protein, partial [Bacteroidota bacterium]